MEFQANQIYHVYNQGNNHQNIFFEPANYLFFLVKMRKYLLPYSDILCYCLMPNHFHFLLVPNNHAMELSKSIKPKSKHLHINKNATTLTTKVHQKKLNQAIGLMLSSYTKAINKKYNKSGSLFRSQTKAKNGWIDEFVTVNGKYKKQFFSLDNTYAMECFDYIYHNPVKAKLVKQPTDWIYSSALDYAGLRNGTLCNQKMARELLGF